MATNQPLPVGRQPQEPQPRGVTATANAVSESLTRLEECVGRLEKRLYQILKPEPPSGPSVNEVPHAVEIRSSLSEDLDGCHRRLEQVVVWISRLDDRADI